MCSGTTGTTDGFNEKFNEMVGKWHVLKASSDVWCSSTKWRFPFAMKQRKASNGGGRWVFVEAKDFSDWLVFCQLTKPFQRLELSSTLKSSNQQHIGW